MSGYAGLPNLSRLPGLPLRPPGVTRPPRAINPYPIARQASAAPMRTLQTAPASSAAYTLDPSIAAAIRSRATGPSASPAGPAAAPATASGAGGGGAGVGDWSSDPILQQILAAAQQGIAQSEAEAAAARKQAAIQFGDPTLALRYTHDQGTAEAAGKNPFSTLKTLLDTHVKRDSALDEGANAANLFYSSTRGVQLGDESKQYLREQSNAQDSVQQRMSAIEAQLQQARQQWVLQQLAGMEAAYGRYLSSNPQGGYPAQPQYQPPPPPPGGNPRTPASYFT